jgi:acyl-CoA reductase-like NAD-dependent aldehyde dehydrogenase
LIDVNHDMRIMKEETFGPVIPIMKVRDAAEALRLANDSPYGLGASVFSRNREVASMLAEQIESGAVCVNDSLVNFIVPDTAMGGIKESGFGYRHGPEGIRKYCRQKSIVIDRFGLKQEFPWYPSSEQKARQTRHLLRLLCRSGWPNKWRALRGLIKG